MDEFREFNKYLAHMESQGAHRAGVAKVNIYYIDENTLSLITGILLITNLTFLVFNSLFQMILE